MREELELMELIENYLNRRLTEKEKLDFEKRMAADTSLKEAVELQKKLMKGIERVALKQSSHAAFKKYKFNKNLKNWGLGGTGLTVLIVGIFFLFAKVLNPRPNENAAQPLPALNENGEKLWSDADKYLPAQYFELNADKDTVVETNDGIVFAIPAHSFLTVDGKPASGRITLEIKEALKASDILKGGLSTKSGDQLLETGGMFYLNARKDGHSLTIDLKNPLRAQIPTNEVKDDMQLYQGNRLANGSIDWINPKPLEKDLIPVDILSLNFYPPHYLDSLQQWGYNRTDKRFTDSLYYAFAAGNRMDEPAMEKAGKIFRQNCAVCHSLGTNKITGPGLRDVTYRVPGGDWLHSYIKNNEKLVRSGDAYAVKISKYDASQMTIFENTLADEEIALLINFLKANDGNSSIRQADSVYSEATQPYTHDFEAVPGINPAQIKAIWDTHFQNTLLATKEFEERLSIIHCTCDESILNLYINNLDKNLYEIDSTVATWEITLNEEFVRFAARRDGKVKNGDKNVELLKKYYAEKSKLYREAITKVQKEFWDKQDQFDDEAGEKKIKHVEREAERMLDNLVKEVDINLTEAVRQLGVKKLALPRSTYAATISSTGWNNVDKAVLESVVARTTLDYTDPQSGKKAVIVYNPLTITVSNYKNYDRVLVYLLPDEFNSFMRLQNKQDVFEEKVTKLMLYKLVCIAYKGDESFYYSQDNVKAGAAKVSLIKSSNDVIQNNINQLGKLSQVKAMNDELQYMAFVKQDERRKAELVKLKELTDKVKPVIFPCFSEASPALAKDTAKTSK
jgi:mono/diheme cytochrome c family protein